jgi:subtilisin family serine protease
MRIQDKNAKSELAKSELINSEEGIVRLSFKSAEEAQAALKSLRASDSVLHVAPNLLYRPALSMSFAAALEADTEDTFDYSAPLNWLTNIAAQGLPPVELPSGAMRPGKDPLVERDWAIKNINLKLDRRDLKASGMIVAVIDTGVDYNHEDLAQAMWRKPGNPREIGYDFAHNNATPYDVVNFDMEGCLRDSSCSLGIDTGKYLSNPGHGTHCAGHVGAMANNSLGIAGVGLGAKVMGLKFFYDKGEENAGRGDDAAAIKSIDYAIKNGAKVISASWGGRVKRSEAEESELKEALIRAQKAGVLVVIAAGNDGIDQDGVEDPNYPAAYELDNTIVVAATDKNDALADFSNYGAQSVHIGAPGVKILSTVAGNQYRDVITKFKDRNGKSREVLWNGTSMATPIVAGAAALIWSQHPNLSYREVRDLILNNARPVRALQGMVKTGGILDVEAALRAAW